MRKEHYKSPDRSVLSRHRHFAARKAQSELSDRMPGHNAVRQAQSDSPDRPVVSLHGHVTVNEKAGPSHRMNQFFLISL